jgi:hypothetical protein
LQDKAAIRDKLLEFGFAPAENATLDTLVETLSGIDANETISIELPEGSGHTFEAGYYKGITVTATTDKEGDAGRYLLFTPNQVIPNKSTQTLNLPEGYYGFRNVTVGPIPNAY